MKPYLRVSVAALATLTGLLVAAVPPASADPDTHPGTVAERPRDAGVHVVDGEVHSLAQVGSRVVVGGTFTQVGPVTRGAVGVVDLAARSFGPGFPDVVGAVTAVAGDGAGGWYLGGTFSSVGGQPRTNLAHVAADGTVLAYAPNPNGPVTALLAMPGGGMVVGGDFTAIAGTPGRGIARFDATDQLAWTGDANGPVRALALSGDGSRVYLGGGFLKVDDADRKRLAAVSATTGDLDPAFVPGVVNNDVHDLVVQGPDVWVAGDFTKVNNVARQRLARVDGATGALGAFSVAINNSVRDIALDTSSNTVYLAGRFGQVGGVNRAKVAGVDIATGAPTALNLTNLAGEVDALALDGAGGLFLGGSLQVTPEKDNPAIVAKVTLASGATTAVVPYAQTPRSLARPPVSGVSGATELVLSGGSLLVAGDFSDYGVTTRNRIFAYELATGALVDGFDPGADSDVNTVKATPDGTAVYVGGDFQTLAGTTQKRMAKLSIADGSPVPGFDADMNSFVKDMAVRPDGTAVYVGGNFSTVNGAAASRLVALDPQTGALAPGFDLPLTEPTNEDSEGGLRAMALSPDSTRLMVIGNFRKVGGVDRPLVAQIDVSQPTATVTSWRTDLYDQPCARSGKIGFMRDVDISPDGATAYVVSAGHFYYPACDTANAFPMAPAPNVAPVWSKKIGDTLESVAAGQDAVYLSGHFRYLETETKSEKRFQIAAVDPVNGNGLNWVPNAGGFRGVLTLELEPAGLFAGSDGDAFGVVNHGRQVFWPTPTPGVEVRKSPNRSWVVTPSGAVSYTVSVLNTYADRPVTLTALTDTRLGALAGQGSCVLPQTIPPAGRYSCTVGETVAGAALTEATGTVTATADAAGTTVTDTDTSLVQVLATDVAFRMRTVVGPGVVAFPSGDVRFNVTLMNLDPVRTATATALTSPQFGDVSAACGLPRALAPNTLVYCHVDLPVGGPVGSKPTYSFTGSMQYATGTLSATTSSALTINPPVGGTKALVVVANPAALTASEKKIEDRLEDAYALTYVDDNTVTTADVTADYSLVVLDPSVSPTVLGTRLAGLTTPVLVTHGQLLDEMGMTAAGANGSGSGTQVSIVRPMHPLAAGKTGTLTVHSAARPISWGQPTGAGEVIAQLEAGKPTLFAYRSGAGMASGTAPGCRVFANAADTTKANATAWEVFNRAAAYASMDCGRNMLWTAAGNGTTTYPGDGNQSLSVGLNQPWGLAVDAQGRVYVADSGTHAVRRIDLDGRVFTVAGTGTAGYAGDGGPATAARLNAPVRLDIDTAGNLYIADSGNHRIRKVATNGVITTVAGTGTGSFSGDGGQATAARLKTPYDVKVLADGTMYIADRGNVRIRKVTPAGIISTVAGSGQSGYNGDDITATTARLNNPYSIDVDADGTLYVADFDNERIRAVSTSGIITTVAGTGIATADGDGGLAVEAGLHKPQYVQVTPQGDLLISESNNNDVRVVHDGVIDTLAGSRQFGYVGDGGPPLFSTWSRPSATVLDAQGNLWIADRNNRRLRVIQAS